MKWGHNVRRALQAALLLAVCLMVPACKSKVDKAHYDQIKVGMTDDEVEKILGKGTKYQEGDGGGMVGQVGVVLQDTRAKNVDAYTWESGDSQIIVYYRDGKVANKMSKGLE
jgi:hypothetical protein